MSDAWGGIEIAEFGSGDGMPIAMLHEGLGSLAMWREFPTRLAQATGRKVIAWSRKGYGNSSAFDGRYELDFMHREADAAAQLLAELGIERAHLFGHSDGASIALLLAARHPRQVASLVLEAPHVFVEPVCLEAISRLASADVRLSLTNRLAKYHRASAAVLDQWLAIWLDPAFASWSIEAELDSITAPLLLIQGEDDEYGTFAQLDRIAERLAWAEQLRLDRCGHSPHRDREADVLRAATRFLESQSSLTGAST
jgi:pimeloyl-ACP methyl ester carboxylesterase